MKQQMKQFINHKNDDLQFPPPHSLPLGDYFAGRRAPETDLQLAAVATRIQPVQTPAQGVWSWTVPTPRGISKVFVAALTQVRPSATTGHQPAVKIGIWVLSTWASRPSAYGNCCFYLFYSVIVMHTDCSTWRIFNRLRGLRQIIWPINCQGPALAISWLVAS